MKKFLCFSLLVFAVLLIYTSGVAHAVVLVSEPFVAGLTENTPVNGFSDSYSVGLGGAWSELSSNGAVVKGRASTAANASGWLQAEANLVANGIGMSLVNPDGNFNWIECNSWGVEKGQAPLASPIDMREEGTWYMSLTACRNVVDYAAQIGLNDGTNELMVGNGYKAKEDGTQGVSAWYDLMANHTTGGSLAGSSGISPTQTDGYNAQLYIAKLVNDGAQMNVGIYAYDLVSITSTPSESDTPLWTTTLPKPEVVFTNCEFNLSANGYPGTGYFRIATTWNEVLPIPEPSTIVMLVLGVLGIAFYARRK
jgi:hypothetical protein